MNRRARLLIALCVASAGGVMAPARAQYNCIGVSPASNTTVTGTDVVTGLDAPLFVTAPRGDTTRIFVVEKGGRIRIHKHGQPPDTLQTFLDITARVADDDGEMGLLGLAFDPAFATTRRFWVHYTEDDGDIYTVVARYTASLANPDVADTTETRLFRVEHPETNHKGGMIAFGSDGFLYVGVGDGGGGGDNHGECGNGQDRSVLLGKILRVDVRGLDPNATAPDCGLDAANYTIPSTNPFRDGAGGLCDEIWAYGLRNPWRFSFDVSTGDLYVGDVGQGCTEEVDYAARLSPGGQNYGWRQMEGSHCFDIDDEDNCDPSGVSCPGSPPCFDPGLALPVAEYSHSDGCSITGGYVYRGCRMPNVKGRYFYGDYCNGETDSFVISNGVATNPVRVTPQFGNVGSLSSYGVDGQGELYAVSLGGIVRKFVPPFADLEVSGKGAGTTLRLSKSGSWTWENLFTATDVPVSFYRVYRGTPGGAYACVLRTTTPSWTGGGDSAVPSPGQLFTYVVTAVNASGVETKRGTSGTFNATSCP